MLQAASGKSNSKKLSSLNSTIVEEDEAKLDPTYNQADNIPDVCKSDLQNSNSSQESQEPDIVRSSSSSSSSSSSDRLCRPLEKTSKPSTVSSFSSSDESATFSDSTRRHFRGSNSKLKRQPLVSQNSGDNDVFEPTPTTALANYGNNPEPQNYALSEKGQRARSDFCSSGYGTGSGENSTSKTSAQLSADLDNELTAVTSEKYPEDLQDNVSNTSTVGSALPADNIGNISSKHNQSNNITVNATKASNTCSDQISSPLMDNAIKSYSLPSVLIDSNNPGAISRASLIDHLRKTSSNLSTGNSSPSSTGSYFITPSNEAALTVHSSISSSLIRQMCSSGPGSQPLESQNIDSLKFSLTQPKKKHEASLPTLVSDCGSYAINLLLEKLERTARCEEVQCDDENCSQIKKCINELKNCNLEGSSLSDNQRNLLLQMALHDEHCTLPRCPFTWCGTSAIDALSQEEKIENMLKRVENFTDNQIIFSTSYLKYMERSSQISFSVMPQEKVHWQRLCMVENSSKVLLASRIIPHQPETSYWIIKKVAYNDNEESLWQICSKLRQMNCSHVVKMLWAASFEDHLLICSEYEGYHSLQESLQANSSNGLDIGLVHTIMLQLTDAAYHLHLQNIIYLNWASSNIVRTHQTDQRIAVKLCNFTTSALADTYDEGYLRLALPTYLLSPELCTMNKVVPESDVWGLGCILYELLTGHPIWHAHRHLSHDDLFKMMKERFQQVIPGEELNGVNLANMCPSLKSIFKSCWNVKPEERKSVLEIQILLVESFVQSNQNTQTA
ncbi:unnamed protein product [Lymnaea stagnalis]|uniref:non-specific serine/threonine protein kinase n=1 Tax=Lymnaea stagnalis TaxID=6523 RepID=A0AAV2H6D2_LYMST